MQAPDSKIAVTLFNLRDYCKTPEDLDQTLQKVRDIGYQAIQFSGCPVDAKTVKELMDKYELFCCATHDNLNAYKNEFDAVVEKNKTLGCDFTALGHPGGDFFCEGGPAKFVKEFNELGKKYIAEGIKLAFHNHQGELEKFGADKKTFLDQIYDDTDPNCVFAEIDVHWVTRGGGSPVAWINKVKGRMPVVHFKDFAIVGGEPKFCEIGEGNLDWPAIIQACEDTGVRWYSIEQDQTFKDRDIFESIKISFDNLKAMGVK